MNNPLETRRGRLVTFFFLYVTEGIPLGFTATAIVAQMRRQGLGPAVTGAFVASLYLPWSWKWIAGPVVDVCSSDRFGRRRVWIVGCQLLMVATLLAGLTVDFTTQVAIFTAIILMHNFFGAVQDVAIDALACETLLAEERGIANGLMFAGAYLGNAMGGSGVLFLQAYLGDFRLTFPIVGAAILMVTVTISLRLKETRRSPARTEEETSPWKRVTGDLRQYIVTAFRAFFRTRLGFLGVVFALLPCGSYSLGLVLQTNLAVEMGLADSEIAWLSLGSTVLSAGGCIVGGRLSDLYGRRFCIGLFIALTSLPVLALAAYLAQGGWFFIDDFQKENEPAALRNMILVFWSLTLVYSFVHGLTYGTRTALFMDLVQVEIAATQFTAYMALLNVVLAYTAAWQGAAIEHWGYPATLALDGVLGLLCLGVLPFLKPPGEAEGALVAGQD